MKAEIWNEPETKGPKPVKLRLVYDESEIDLVVVDERGDLVAELVCVAGPDAGYRYYDAKGNLESQGYDTSFARWNRHGQMLFKGID